MPLKNKLSQYELDTALAVLRDKGLPVNDLRSKTIAVSGGGDHSAAILYRAERQEPYQAHTG